MFNLFSHNSENDTQEDEIIARYHDKRDLEDNNLTKPPSDEKVKIPSIWAFEIYTSSTKRSLYNGIKNLGLSDYAFAPHSNYEESIDNLRFRVSGGGWLNLGVICDESTEIPFSLPMAKAKLPTGILYIELYVFQYLPNTTLLSCRFFFDEETTNSLNEPLCREYSTYEEKTKSGVRYIEVFHQKKTQTDTMRSYLKNLCTDWIAKCMPGYFSSKPLQNSFPTCELILLTKHKPLDEIGNKKRSFLSMLDLDKKYNTWYREGIKGLYLYLPDNNWSGSENAMILSGNIEDLLSNEVLNIYGSGPKEKSILNWLSEFNHTLGIWVLSVIAFDYEHQLGRLRDNYGEVMNNDDLNHSLENIQQIDKHFIQIGIIHFFHELKSICKNRDYFMRDVYEFKRVQKSFKLDTDLFESIRKRLINLSSLMDLNIKHTMTSANIISQSTNVGYSSSSGGRFSLSTRSVSLITCATSSSG